MKRIQRKRTKGWRMPENTVYVGRGSIWGNPYKIEGMITREMVLAEFRRYVQTRSEDFLKNWLAPLRGKDLACWCKETDACHADILLEFLDKPEEEELAE